GPLSRRGRRSPLRLVDALARLAVAWARLASALIRLAGAHAQPADAHARAADTHLRAAGGFAPRNRVDVELGVAVPQSPGRRDRPRLHLDLGMRAAAELHVHNVPVGRGELVTTDAERGAEGTGDRQVEPACAACARGDGRNWRTWAVFALVPALRG